jgi:hypothetical protein
MRFHVMAFPTSRYTCIASHGVILLGIAASLAALVQSTTGEIFVDGTLKDDSFARTGGGVLNTTCRTVDWNHVCSILVAGSVAEDE